MDSEPAPRVDWETDFVAVRVVALLSEGFDRVAGRGEGGKIVVEAAEGGKVG